jgi:hypothetical protein
MPIVIPEGKIEILALEITPHSIWRRGRLQQNIA